MSTRTSQKSPNLGSFWDFFELLWALFGTPKIWELNWEPKDTQKELKAAQKSPKVAEVELDPKKISKKLKKSRKVELFLANIFTLDYKLITLHYYQKN